MPVDFVFMDYTNNYRFAEYDTTLETYCKISEELKNQGIDVLKIVFFSHGVKCGMPGGLKINGGSTMIFILKCHFTMMES